MKAGIVTIKEIIPNFGNSLQNYAAVKILERMNIEAITLCFEFNHRQLQKIRLKEWLQRHLGYCLPGHKDYWKYTAARIMSFDKFSRKYCPYQFVSSTEGLKEKFDFFAVGSDQVWNPNWYRGSEMKQNMYLLAFADVAQKICISPSFGVTQLPESWENYFTRYLLDFPVCLPEKNLEPTLSKS